MHLSLTCACGARLEIDEKFRGQTITCPDCHKPLPTVQPPRAPKKTSAFALASPLLALIGAFTLVGPVLAVACGAWGLRSISRSGERLEGRRLAKVGIALGLVFSLLGAAAFFWADWIGLDGVVRGLEWADKLDYAGDLHIKHEETQGQGFSLDKPNGQWARFTGASAASGSGGDLLVLVHFRDDAYVLVQKGNADFRDDLKECGFKALEQLTESPFLRRLGRLKPADKFPDLGKPSAYKEVENADKLEIQLDTKLAGIPRTLMMRVQRVGGQLFVVTCLTRKHRFDRLEETFQKVLDSFAVEQ